MAETSTFPLDGDGLREVVWDECDAPFAGPFVASPADAEGRGIALSVTRGGEAVDLTGASLYLLWRHREPRVRGCEPLEEVDEDVERRVTVLLIKARQNLDLLCGKGPHEGQRPNLLGGPHLEAPLPPRRGDDGIGCQPGPGMAAHGEKPCLRGGPRNSPEVSPTRAPPPPPRACENAPTPQSARSGDCRRRPGSAHLQCTRLQRAPRRNAHGTEEVRHEGGARRRPRAPPAARARRRARQIGRASGGGGV